MLPVSSPLHGPTGLLSALEALAPHEIRLVSGLSLAGLRDLLAVNAPPRPVLSLDLMATQTVQGGIALALASMAKTAASLWPCWWGEDWSSARDDVLNRAHRPVRLASLSRSLPSLSPAWAQAAIGHHLRGTPPRVPAAAPSVEWAQLALAVSPSGLLLAVPLEPGPWLAARIQVVEWLAQRGRVSVLVLTDNWPVDPAFERIMHGAGRFELTAAASAPAMAEAEATVAAALVLPPAPEGRPHPMSPSEQALHRRILADEELRPLFAFNKTVADAGLLNVRADLLWSGGRVAVEIDGADHRAPMKFRADRHRDYELMCAGYRVLRITNEDIIADVSLAVEKIRRVVRLAKGETV